MSAGTKLLPWGLFGGVLMAALVLACNGNGGEEPAVIGPLDVSRSCQLLREADAYRYSFEYLIESPEPAEPLGTEDVGDPAFGLPAGSPDFTFGQQVEGSIVNPDSAEMVITTLGTAGGLPLLFVAGREWTMLGGDWIETPSGGVLPFPPTDVCDAIVGDLDASGVVPIREEINGTEALRFRVEQADINPIGKLFGGQTGPTGQTDLLQTHTVQAWIGVKDGRPLRLEAESVGTYPSGRELRLELALEIEDFNDKGISIRPPTE